MNRILKRPMFRMGGSTGTGITSGLDAPRQKYKQAGSVQPNFDMAKVLRETAAQTQDPAIQQAYQPFFQRPKGEGLSRFLTTFGLDLLSRPPQGGFLSTVAAAAKEPTAQLYKDIDEQRLTKQAGEADLFKTLLQGNIDIAAEAAGNEGGGKTYAKLEVANDIENTMDIIFKLEKKQQDNPDQFSEDDALLLDKKKERLRGLTKNDEVIGSLLGDSDYTQKILRKIKTNLIDLKNPDGTPKYPEGEDDAQLLEDMNRFYIEFFKTGEFPEFKAEGGRAGYQMGGGADMNQMPAQDDDVKIDYGTLRARLPREISDDIVKLISTSPEAMEDFATISTQQDVDMFNQKYSVNLVLPQEA